MKGANAGPSRRVRIEHDLSCYSSILTSERRRALFEAAGDGRLERPIFDLVSGWARASDAHVLPDVVTVAATSSVQAHLAPHLQPTEIETLLNAIVDRATARGATKFTASQRRALAAAAHADVAKFKNAKGAIDDWSREKAWRDLLREHAFKSAIVGLEFFAFTTLYFSYETYLAEVAALLTGKWPRPSPRIRKALADELGEGVAGSVWDDDRIVAARIVRDAHVHRADRLTATEVVDVEKFVPCDSVFALVTARETHLLTEELLPRVLTTTEAVRRKLGEI